MKIAIAQLNFHVGNIPSNKEKITTVIRDSKANGIDLVVFSELAICGYPPRDLLTYPAFVSKCIDAIHLIAAECNGIAAIVGGPSINPANSGKALHNSAFFLVDGLIKQVVNKSLLPDYDVFDESRYFEPASQTDIIEYKNRKIALTICEDIWNTSSEKLYNLCPLDNLIRKQPDLLVNIAASPFSKTHQNERLGVFNENIDRYNLPLIYVNQTGAQTDLLFDGASLVLDADKKIVCQLPVFEEHVAVIELTIARDDAQSFDLTSLTNCTPEKLTREALLYKSLVTGVKDYFTKCGFTKTIIGLSGGIDSALVAAIAADALGPQNVSGILMPSKFSSLNSIDDAYLLAKNLGIETQAISIEEINKSFDNSLYALFKNTSFGVAEENIQARIRGVLLMGISNKFGHVVLNTTNKSEMAVGYGTLYGDMCGALAVLGDLYKTEVYAICKYLNSINPERIPSEIINKAPSAELRPNQKDTDSLPEYSILDKILNLYIEKQCSLKDILAFGFDEETVNKIIRLVNLNEYKRFQAAPVLRVSSKSFGLARRMPLEGKYLILKVAD